MHDLLHHGHLVRAGLSHSGRAGWQERPEFRLHAVTPQPPSSVTVTAGSPASYTIAVAPTGSFTGTVNLSCASSPATSTITCSFSPATVTLGSGQNVTLTVSTIKRGVLPPT